MTKHIITIDSDSCGDSAQDAFRAYCTDECGWRGEWVHADEFFHLADRYAGAASDMAYNEAVDQGRDHLDEQDD